MRISKLSPEEREREMKKLTGVLSGNESDWVFKWLCRVGSGQIGPNY